MTLGEKIKEIRRAHGLTQEQFADRLEISRSVLSQVEIDRIKPSIETLKRISNDFSVTLDYLIHDNENIRQSGLIAGKEDEWRLRRKSETVFRAESRHLAPLTANALAKEEFFYEGDMREIPFLSIEEQERLKGSPLMKSNLREFERIRLPLSGRQPAVAFETLNALSQKRDIYVCELTSIKSVRRESQVIVHTKDKFLNGLVGKVTDLILTISGIEVPVSSIIDVWIVKLIVSSPITRDNLITQISNLTGMIANLQKKK
jgi:transcriptional regulator with XRE-family HTH domain